MTTSRTGATSISSAKTLDTKFSGDIGSYNAGPPATTLPLRFRVVGMSATESNHEIYVQEHPNPEAPPLRDIAPMSSHTLPVSQSQFHQYRVGQVFRLVLESEPLMKNEGGSGNIKNR